MPSKYKNIVGTAFSPYVKDQLTKRSSIGKINPRSSKELQFLTNRNAWFRLSSSSTITDDKVPVELANPYGPLEENSLSRDQIVSTNTENLKVYNNSFKNNLAKENILQGGLVVSGKDNSTLIRKGFKNTYSAGGNDNLGLQPMPGITGITVGTGGKWQTLMQADIEFICYNLDQLDLMSKLYMSLGVTCFLEWGHIPYITNEGTIINNPTNLDFFGEKDKVNLIKQVTKKREDTDGNYDAFLGTVYNFSYESDKDGAYMCKTQLMGAGGMVESLKINTSFNIDYSNTNQNDDAEKFDSTLDNALYTMSEFLSSGKIYEITKGVKYNASADNWLTDLVGKSATTSGKTISFGKIEPENFFKDYIKIPKNKNKKGETYNTNWGDTLNQIYGSSTYSPFNFSGPFIGSTELQKGHVNYINDEAKYGNAFSYITGLDNEGLDEIPTDFYSGYAGMWNGESPYKFFQGDKQTLTFITLGHLFALVNSLGIFVESNTNIPNPKQVNPVLYIDYHPDNTIISLAPITATSNPFKILVPFRENTPYRDFFHPLPIDGIYKYPKGDDEKNLAQMNLSRNNNDVPNKVNQVYPPEKFVGVGREKFGGKLMNALVNIDFARGCLRSSKDSDNNVNLIEFVSKILDGVNECLGGVNNLRPFVDECGMILRIVDEKVIDPQSLKENLVELPIFGLTSISYDSSYSSAITPKLAAQIVIATQAIGSNGIKDFSEDVLSYQYLNGHIKDRFSTYKFPAVKEEEEGTEDSASKRMASLLKLYEHLYAIYSSSFPSPVINGNIVKAMASPWIDRTNQISKCDFAPNETKEKPNNSVLIPLEYQITLDGIGGILPYNAFLIPNNRLPERYKGKVAFCVFSINHSFENNNWYTNLRGQTIMLDTPKTPQEPAPIPKSFPFSPNPSATPSNFTGTYPKVTNTGVVTTDSPNYTQEDSPVNDVTNTGGGEQVITTTTTPDGRQSISISNNPVNTSPSDINAAFDFIKNQETPGGNPELEAYKDIDYTVSEGFSYRIGFGSDTITRANGTVEGVIRSSRITKQEAILDLKRRINLEFKPKVVKRLSERGINYDDLPLKIKVVFIDLAYNYGTLFYDIIDAFKSGGKAGLILELENRIARGKRQVPTRRQAEINYLNG